MSVEEPDNQVDPNALRAELKQWEADFRARNGGTKPGRADIKSDVTIAAKYKLYDQLTKRGSQPSLPPPATTPKKNTRHSDSRARSKPSIAATPKKGTKATPSKTRPTLLELPALSPVQEQEPTPAFIRNALGPTPQKDGHILGIFDAMTDTPSQEKNEEGLGIDTVIAATPSKAMQESSNGRLSRTPQSLSKRFFLDAFAGTPLKRKREDDTGPASSAKRQFATPSFLRRSFPMASINGETGEDVPVAHPFKKRGLVRSLSSIIQGLRKQEEKHLDDEWDVLNEIENEEHGGRKPKKVSKDQAREDHAGEMPLGPDQAAESSEDSAGENVGTTRKPWKKKGLKRQTRRVIMRPVTHKTKKVDDQDPSDDEPGIEAEPPKETGNDEEQEDGSDFQEDQSTTKKSKTEKPSSKATSKKSTEKEDKGEKRKSKARKVNEAAHANFRKLKIKNKNSKANGRGGRFGRR